MWMFVNMNQRKFPGTRSAFKTLAIISDGAFSKSSFGLRAANLFCKTLHPKRVKEF